jgi:hypothetical protein
MIELKSSTKDKSHSELLMFAKLLIGSLIHPIFNLPVMQVLVTRLKELTDPYGVTQEMVDSPLRSAKLRDQRAALTDHLTILITQAQLVLNQTELTDGERTTIAQSVGLEARVRGRRPSQKFSVQTGANSGEVTVTAEGGPRAHEVQYTDDLVTFSNKQVVVSTRSITTITGLKPGTRYAVFHRPHGPRVEKGLEGPLFITAL